MDENKEIVAMGKIYQDGKLYMPQKIRQSLNLNGDEDLFWTVKRLPNGQKYIVISTELLRLPEAGFSIKSIN